MSSVYLDFEINFGAPLVLAPGANALPPRYAIAQAHGAGFVMTKSSKRERHFTLFQLTAETNGFGF